MTKVHHYTAATIDNAATALSNFYQFRDGLVDKAEWDNVDKVNASIQTIWESMPNEMAALVEGRLQENQAENILPPYRPIVTQAEAPALKAA